MNKPLAPFTENSPLALQGPERSILNLINNFEDLLAAHGSACLANDASARNRAAEALRDAYSEVANSLFIASRNQHSRKTNNRAAGIDPNGPHTVGYLSREDLDRLDSDDQAFIDPPSCTHPNGIPVFVERPLSAIHLAQDLQRVAKDYASGLIANFDVEAQRILARTSPIGR